MLVIDEEQRQRREIRPHTKTERYSQLAKNRQKQFPKDLPLSTASQYSANPKILMEFVSNYQNDSQLEPKIILS